MKKFTHPINIVLAGLVLFVLVYEIFSTYDESSSRREIRSLSAALRRVSSLRLGEGPRYLREIGYVTPWLKEDINLLTIALRKNESTKLLKSEQIADILNAFILAGRSASSATSAVLLYLDHESEYVRLLALRSLLAFRSAPESVSSLLEKDCSYEVSECASREILLRELEEYANISSELKDGEKKRYKDVVDILEKEALSAILATKTDSQVISQHLVRTSLFSRFLSKSFQDDLLKTFAETKDLEVKRSIFLVLVQVVKIKDAEMDRTKIVKWLSERMQYDKEYKVRELAAIVLSRIGTPDSVSEVKAYGHKISTGDVLGPVKNPHPFVEWGRSSRTESEASQQIE